MTIPAELINIPQWVLWRLEDRGGPKKTKVPYHPNGYPCDVTNPANFSTYEACVAVAHLYSGLGFCLTEQSRVSVIDLDNPFERIEAGILIQLPRNDPQACETLRQFEETVRIFDSYTEWSQSYRGLHIFVFGLMPAEWGKRADKFEVYSRDRFIAVTGYDYTDIPHSTAVEERQFRLEEFGRDIGLAKVNAGIEFDSRDQTRSDEDVISAVARSKVGDAFLRLYNGDMGAHQSGSEADLALANYIAFATDNKEQCKRIFIASHHFTNRPKLHERTDYLVDRLVNLAFDRKLPTVNVDALRATLEGVTALQAAPPAAPPLPDEEGLTTRPRGLMGDVADYIYNSAPYGVPEYALAGALGLMAGICGRAFNYAGSGLNQYVVVVGRSGSGKDAISSGISRLLSEFEQTIPAAKTFQGPDGIASEPALYKLFDREKGGQPSLVCGMPEFGEWLQVHLDPRADHTKKSLVRAFMNIYTKSTKGSETGGLAYSDREKNVKTAKSPAFSFIGDTVPSTFYEACTEAAIEKGLLPRLFVIERKAGRPEMNKTFHLWRPSPDFLTRLGYLIARCLELNEKNDVVQVTHTEEAAQIIEAFRLECDRHYHNPGSEAAGNMWSRGHVKAMRLAALLAVGVNWVRPIIEADQARWACEMALRDIKNMLSRINSGEIEVRNESTGQGNAYTVEQRAFASVYVRHMQRPHDKLNAQFKGQVTEAAHNAGYMREATFRGLCKATPPLRKDPRKDVRTKDIIRSDFTGVLRVGLPDTIDVTAVSRLGLKPDVEYVFATDIDLIKVMAGITETDPS